MIESAASDQGSTLGARLRHVRGSANQKVFAESLGIATGTYQNYERDDRVPDAYVLARLAAAGWNANWLLTGEGPERLGAPYQAGSTETNSRVGEPGASHALRVDLLTMAVELIDSELERAGRALPPEKRALAYTLIYEELLEPGDELPTAKVLKLVLRAV